MKRITILMLITLVILSTFATAMSLHNRNLNEQYKETPEKFTSSWERLSEKHAFKLENPNRELYQQRRLNRYEVPKYARMQQLGESYAVPFAGNRVMDDNKKVITRQIGTYKGDYRFGKRMEIVRNNGGPKAVNAESKTEVYGRNWGNKIDEGIKTRREITNRENKRFHKGFYMDSLKVYNFNRQSLTYRPVGEPVLPEVTE